MLGHVSHLCLPLLHRFSHLTWICLLYSNLYVPQQTPSSTGYRQVVVGRDSAFAIRTGSNDIVGWGFVLICQLFYSHSLPQHSMLTHHSFAASATIGTSGKQFLSISAGWVNTIICQIPLRDISFDTS
jgi:hypothetical protein